MKTLLCCALVLALLHAGSALECYQCVGTTCIDNADCDGGSCMKTVASGGGNEGIVHGCAPSYNAEGCTRQSIAGASLEVCYCNTDLCNDATGAALSLPLLGMAYLLNRIF